MALTQSTEKTLYPHARDLLKETLDELEECSVFLAGLVLQQSPGPVDADTAKVYFQLAQMYAINVTERREFIQQVPFSDLELRAGLAILDSACQYVNKQGTPFALGILMHCACSLARDLIDRGAPVSFRARSVARI